MCDQSILKEIIKKTNFNSEGISALRSEALILASLKHKNIEEYYNVKLQDS